MKFLVFNSEGQANVAQNKIWAVLETGYIARGYSENGQGVHRPDGGKTERWAIARQRLDGKWVFPHPEKSILKNDEEDGKTIEFLCMHEMMAHNVEEHDAEWFVVEE